MPRYRPVIRTDRRPSPDTRHPFDRGSGKHERHPPQPARTRPDTCIPKTPASNNAPSSFSRYASFRKPIALPNIPPHHPFWKICRSHVMKRIPALLLMSAEKATTVPKEQNAPPHGRRYGPGGNAHLYASGGTTACRPARNISYILCRYRNRRPHSPPETERILSLSFRNRPRVWRSTFSG